MKMDHHPTKCLLSSEIKNKNNLNQHELLATSDTKGMKDPNHKVFLTNQTMQLEELINFHPGDSLMDIQIEMK